MNDLETDIESVVKSNLDTNDEQTSIIEDVLSIVEEADAAPSEIEEKAGDKVKEEDAQEADKTIDKVKDVELDKTIDKVTDKEVKDKTEEKDVTKIVTPADEKTKNDMEFIDRFLHEDANKNLVLKDGTIVATHGVSRHYYEKLKNEGRTYRQQLRETNLNFHNVGNKFKELFSAYKDLKEKPNNAEFIKDTGLTDSQFQEGIQLMKQFNADPISAIKGLLTKAQMNGIDLSSIGAAGTIDPATLQTALKSAVQEQFQQFNKPAPVAEQTVEQQHQSAIQEATAFLTKYPDARNFEKEIAAAKTKFPDIGLEEIWLQFQVHLSKQDIKPVETTLSKSSEIEDTKDVTKVVTKPTSKVDYSNMSIAQIAESVKKEF